MTKLKVPQILVGLGLAMILPACVGFVFGVYSAEPIEAGVVDAETKQPIAGVIVTANWQLEEGTMGGNVPVGQLMVLETVTDKDGVFRFPAWGSKSAPKGHLVIHDPQLLLFKPGYEYRRLLNTFTADYNKGMRRRSEWSGRTIEMKPFKGAVGEYADRLSFLGTSLRFAYDGERCEWRQVPRMLAAVHKEKVNFRAKGVFSSLQLATGVSNQAKCGPAETFFAEYLK